MLLLQYCKLSVVNSPSNVMQADFIWTLKDEPDYQEPGGFRENHVEVSVTHDSWCSVTKILMCVWDRPARQVFEDQTFLI